MPIVTFVQTDGRSQTVEVSAGVSAMQAAVSNGISGIEAECGGAASCATCHVYVDEAWVDRLPPVSDDENDMLDCTASPRLPASRLSCQIEIAPDLDGLRLNLPESQS